jgi:hypothetical protein
MYVVGESLLRVLCRRVALRTYALSVPRACVPPGSAAKRRGRVWIAAAMNRTAFAARATDCSVAAQLVSNEPEQPDPRRAPMCSWAGRPAGGLPRFSW